ncbi:hypothetical protein [Streptomyces sp. b84]|nr:hypothetical protein [Streptomyces sp. b84]
MSVLFGEFVAGEGRVQQCRVQAEAQRITRTLLRDDDLGTCVIA